MYDVYANMEALEGTVSMETTLTLKRRSRKITITNDHATNDLSFKFNSSEDFATVKGTESVDLIFRTESIIINGNGDYRIWVFG